MQRAIFAPLLAAALVLAGCGASKPKPTPLLAFEPKIATRVAWNARVDSVRFPLVITARNGVFFVAGTGGTVLALKAEDGSELWRASAGDELSAGVGSDGRYASVVTQGNEVVTFDGGRELWRRRLPSRVVSAPLVAGERVFVMSVDRAVHAYDALDGRPLWTLQRPGDALTLAQAGVVTSYRNSLIVGQGARLAALDALRGTLQWEVPMATPRGSNEVERLADLLGPALRLGDKLCARAFQSAVACVDASRAALLWSRNVGGIHAIGGTEELIFGADASDRITAWRTANGETAWTNEKLLYRGLSGALAVGDSVLFGDSEGFLHFLAASSGEPQSRLSTGGAAIVATPALSGDTVLVATRDGNLVAIRSGATP